MSYPDARPRSGIRELNKNERGWATTSTKREVTVKETVTLADLLAQHDAPEVIHYLCLDVEGAERTILESFDFNQRRTILAISVEGSSCDDLLLAAGYRRVRNPFAPESRFDRYFIHPAVDVVRENRESNTGELGSSGGG
jgi:Methyltransferase FkbM domain